MCMRCQKMEKRRSGLARNFSLRMPIATIGNNGRKSSRLFRNTIVSLSAHGNSTSPVEVTNVSAHGILLLAHDQGLLISYEGFPRLEDQPVPMIMNVWEPSLGHFYWPEIDVDLTKEIIEHPGRFANKAKSTKQCHNHPNAEEAPMNEEKQSVQHIVVTSTKSVGVSLILTILFGPLGMLYSTVSGGLIMIFVSFFVALATAGLGLVITWPISIIWGAMAVSSSNQKILAQASRQNT